ncbi:MAG: PD40 domain-containing protein [Planctomycetaceae bacterium]|nr:PD40 domain-containing protein [Planctomycetaceae bacterium]
MKRIGWILLAAALAAPCCNRDINDQTVRIAVTARVSLNSAGVPANLECIDPAVSADGRFLAFVSLATNLSPVPTNGVKQVYVRDLVLGVTEMVSVNNNGDAGTADSRRPTLSADGSLVAFQSDAPNLVPADFNGKRDVFLRKRNEGKTVRVSEADGGGDADDESLRPMISGNGQFVVFSSLATNLTSASTGGQQIFRRDLTLDITELVSVSTTGGEAGGDSDEPSISFDGSRVAFRSNADDLTLDPHTTGSLEVYVRDLSGATTVRISFALALGTEPDGDSLTPAISGDGTRVAFVSRATNLVVSDINGPVQDIYVRDVAGGAILLASRHSSGPQGSKGSDRPVLSHDGRFLAFVSDAPNLVDDDINQLSDVFWRDLASGRTIRLSSSTGNAGGNLASGDQDFPALTGDGSVAYFGSDSTNLIGQDINGIRDIYGRGPLY